MAALSAETKEKWLFGSKLPFAEAPWARGCPSPYYNDSHRRLRQAMRNWTDKYLIPNAQEWEDAAELPGWLYKQAAKDGVLMPMAAGSKIPLHWHGKFPIMGNVDPREWDGFHDFIIHDEFFRIGGVGVASGLIGGITLAVPAIRRFGSEYLQNTVVPKILSGDARIALAVTEPDAGSDVQGLQTESVLSEDGTHFVVNGMKKWITSGMYCDHFLTLTKEASGGFTLLVVPPTKGISKRHMAVSGSNAAGTAFIDFDDVKVPVNMVIGERRKGLKYIMSNFNHERLFLGFQALRCARVCLEDSIDYAISRHTFGKPLTEHAVIRFKFAHMSRETEALQAWIESLIYQLSQLEPAEAEFLLAGTTAQLKAHAGIVLEHVVREAIQIMGGIGLTRGGRGARVERIWRDVKGLTVPGGSEEILLDFATKRALKITAELNKDVVEGKL